MNVNEITTQSTQDTAPGDQESLPPLAEPKTTTLRRIASSLFGYTLIEVLMVVMIIGILTAIAVPSYQGYIKKVKMGLAIAAMQEVSRNIDAYYIFTGSYPASLSEITDQLDPWGNPYQYLSMAGASVGKVRKDKSLHPLNTDYDLYSMGPDGKSASPLTAQISRDDIVRANNGAFLGVAEDY